MSVPQAPEAPDAVVSGAPPRRSVLRGAAPRAAGALPPLVALTLGSLLIFGRAHGLWYDELFSTEVSRLPLADIVRAAWEGRGTTWYLRDIPPSYNLPWYVVAHLWLQLPGTDNDWSLRLFSLLAGAAGVAVLGRAVARLGTPRPLALLAALVVAVDPLFLEWVTEARPYGFAVLGAAATMLALARWLDRRRGAAVLFALAGAATGLAHWYAIGVVAAAVVAGTVLAPRRSPQLMLAGVVAALPVAGLVRLNLATVGDRNAALLYDTQGRMPLFAAWQWAGTSMLTAGVVAALGVAGLLRGPGRLRVVATLWVVLPIAALLLVEREYRPIYEPRYVLPALLGLGLLTAIGAASAVRVRAVAIGLSALLVGSLLWASSALRDAPPRERSDQVAALIAAGWRPGDAVFAGDRQSALGLSHYARTRYPQLAGSLLVPPVSVAPTNRVVWYVRVRIIRQETGPVDGDVLLAAAGYRVERQEFLRATWTSLVVQRWVR